MPRMAFQHGVNKMKQVDDTQFYRFLDQHLGELEPFWTMKEIKYIERATNRVVARMTLDGTDYRINYTLEAITS